MRKVNIAVLLTVLLMISCMMTVGSVLYENAYAQAQTKEEMENEQRPLPGGWINWVSSDVIVIDDTQYIVADETRYPDGGDVLTEGEFVRFRLQKDNILSEIFLGEPRRDEMYMKPVVRAEKGNTPEAEEDISPPVNTNQTEDGEMRLENGVWVN